MSVALSLPAMRNFACCQTKEATSRLVKYFRAASPRANQNSEAPIIIVLSTSKKAAAVRSGAGALGTSVSAAAAEASPATTARVSWSSTSSGMRAVRSRKRTRTIPHHPPGVGCSVARDPSVAGRPARVGSAAESDQREHGPPSGASGYGSLTGPDEVLTAELLDPLDSGGVGEGGPDRLGVVGAEGVGASVGGTGGAAVVG